MNATARVTDPLTTLYGHHLWANLLLLECCAALSDEQLDGTLSGPISGTFGTIRNTLQHIVTSEQSYFSRISTGKRYDRPEIEPAMTMAELVTTAQAIGTGLIEWANRVQADDVVEIDWDGSPRLVPKAILLTQVINHGTEHRSQIMAIMTQLGVEPPDLQPWAYFDAVDDSGWVGSA